VGYGNEVGGCSAAAAAVATHHAAATDSSLKVLPCGAHHHPHLPSSPRFNSHLSCSSSSSSLSQLLHLPLERTSCCMPHLQPSSSTSSRQQLRWQLCPQALLLPVTCCDGCRAAPTSQGAETGIKQGTTSRCGPWAVSQATSAVQQACGILKCRTDVCCRAVIGTADDATEGPTNVDLKMCCGLSVGAVCGGCLWGGGHVGHGGPQLDEDESCQRCCTDGNGWRLCSL
jgi:hypothetical protein